MPAPDYYKILNVSRAASPDAIKHAYRQLALKYHPDLHPNNPRAEEILKAINQAYDILSDPRARRQYDAQTLPTPAPVYHAPQPASRTTYQPSVPRPSTPAFNHKSVLASWMLGLIPLILFGLWLSTVRPTSPVRARHQLDFEITAPLSQLIFVDSQGFLYTSQELVPKERLRAGQTFVMSYTTAIKAGRVFIGVKGNLPQPGNKRPSVVGQWITQTNHSTVTIPITRADEYAVFLNLDQFAGSFKMNSTVTGP